MTRPPTPLLLSAALTAALVGISPLLAQSAGSFTDVSATVLQPTYQRMPSPRLQVNQGLQADSPVPRDEFFARLPYESALKPYGAPGLALFDYDNDGDLDLYVTNGPGAANSLYSNQLQETGSLGFVDVALAAGVAATNQDSTGVCVGDVDNDFDQDLYVLGVGPTNRFFENLGNGTFADRTAASSLAAGARHAISCAMGDFNADGLLDIVIANTYDDWGHRAPDFAGDYSGLEQNQLFFNQGGNVFANASAASGIEAAGPAFSWAVSATDYDLDGDEDILLANQAEPGQTQIGALQVLDNDGTGHFTQRDVGTFSGSFRSLAPADFNCDGRIDLFVTSIGQYAGGDPKASSRILFGTADGFDDPGVGALIGTPSGWGAAVLDYDNDGDPDVVFNGGEDRVIYQYQDNGLVLLRNQGECSGALEFQQAGLADAIRSEFEHAMVVGDVNGDGAEDIITVSSAGVDGWTVPIGAAAPVFGSLFDADASANESWSQSPSSPVVTFNDPTVSNGRVTILLNDLLEDGTDAPSSTIRLIGGFGLLPAARTNRDGDGALVRGEHSLLEPKVEGLSSEAQIPIKIVTVVPQVVRVAWPDGATNRFTLQPGEDAVFVEIPCDFDTQAEQPDYAHCVGEALTFYKRYHLIDEEKALDYYNEAFDGTLPEPTCLLDPRALCLNDDRFKVKVTFDDGKGQAGDGHPVDFRSNDSGMFWFFNSENWEMLVKVLDGCPINGHFWVFAGGTTKVAFRLTVTEENTGAVWTIDNPQGQAATPSADTRAFTCHPDLPQAHGGSSPVVSSVVRGPDQRARELIAPHRKAPASATRVADSATGTCTPSATVLCLNDNRFEVSIAFEASNGASGTGTPVTAPSTDSGLFWFFKPENWEMLVKVLDGCSINHHFWVFAAATTNVGFDLTVRDTVTGETSTRHNAVGVLSPAITDTHALAVCDG